MYRVAGRLCTGIQSTVHMCTGIQWVEYVIQWAVYWNQSDNNNTGTLFLLCVDHTRTIEVDETGLLQQILDTQRTKITVSTTQILESLQLPWRLCLGGVKRFAEPNVFKVEGRFQAVVKGGGDGFR